MTDWLVTHFIRDCGNIRDSAVRQRYGVLSGAVGIILNLLLTASKLLAGSLTGSLAITADAFNNLSDAGSSAVTLAGFRMAGKKADKDHPFGHGRAEYLAGLGVAVSILLVGFELARSSLARIRNPRPLSFSWLSAGILLGSILVKLWMSAFNRHLSQRLHSPAMAAAASDALADTAATAAVLLGTFAGHFFHLSIDGWVGILVAVFILKAGWGAARDTLNPLLGQEPDPELIQGIEETVRHHPEILGVHDMMVHDYGPGRRMVSLHAEVPGDGDIMLLHDVIDAAERELNKKYHLEATIHMDPVAAQDEETCRTRDLVTSLLREIDSGMGLHDFRITGLPGQYRLLFDVSVPYQVRLSDNEVREQILLRLAQAAPLYTPIIQIDRCHHRQI
jgi:cation diffusion facilitator family transporter